MRTQSSCVRKHLNLVEIQMTTPKNIRIKDIAKMAGVSQGTVDRVLHNRGNISASALSKVNEVLEKINYRPNLIARSLVRGENLKIAVIIPDPELDAYWAEAQRGISQAQEEWAHYGVLIQSYYYVHDGNSSLEHSAQEVLKAKPDGVVIAPLYYQQAVPILMLLNEKDIPYILFNTNIPESKSLGFIGQDLYQSGMLAGQLMSLDHENHEKLIILNIGKEEDMKDSIYLKEKEQGFKAFFERNAHYSYTIECMDLDHTNPSFEKKVETLIDDKNVKGFFITTSRAVSTISSILDQSARKDIRLIGYDLLEDNLNYLKKGVIRFLINQNPKRQSFLGISHLANHLLFKKVPPKMELFPLEIITQQNIESYIASAIH